MGCPDDQTLLAMLEHSVDPAQFNELEVHIDACPHCRKAVAALALGSRSPDAPHTPFAGLDPDLASGATIAGRYVVVSELGRGGMGTVYVARDQTLGREVALKLHRAGSGNDRLQREAIAMAKLAHPNVVNVFEVASVDDRMFVAMEYVRGGTLRSWLAAEPRSWRQIVAMLVQAGRGLAAAHAAGLVHRDFKPENVLVGEDGRPRVGDFGLARTSLRDSSPRLGAGGGLATAQTMTMGVAGTPAYMAPEQLADETVDARSDQFAFAVVAWEALYGKRPFAGATLAAIQLAIEHHELDRSNAVPDRVRRVIERGLETSPGARHPDMPAMLAALERAAAPRTTRNVIATVAVAAVIATGAYVTFSAVTRHQHEAACTAARAEVGAIFGAPVRLAMRTAFLVTRSPVAPGAYDHTAAVLDRYALALGDQVEAVCRDRDQPDRVLAARRACLGTHRDDFAGLVDQLVHADAELVPRAPDAAWAVFDASPCTDAVPASVVQHAPADAAKLARIKGMMRTGRYKEGVELVTPLVADARARKDMSLELDALITLAQLQDEVDETAAIASYHDAEALAEAQGRDLEAAQALASLALAAGTVQHDYLTAHRQVELARAKVARVGGNAAIEGRIAMTEAQVFVDENRIAEAERAMQTSVATFEKAYGPDHPNVGNAYGVLSQVERGLGRNTEALAAAKKTLAILAPALGAEHPTVAGSKMNLAQVLIDHHDYAEAKKLLLDADASFRAVYGDVHPLRAAIYGNLGTSEMAQEHWDAAIAAYTTARDIIVKTGNDPTAFAGVERDLTNALGGAGRLDEALVECKRGIAALEKLGPDGAPRLPQSLNDLGEVQLARGHGGEAIADVERGLSLLSEHGKDVNPVDLADTQFILGKLYYESGKDRARGHALVELAAKRHPIPDRQALMQAWLKTHAS